jgi:hypothetical protein
VRKIPITIAMSCIAVACSSGGDASTTTTPSVVITSPESTTPTSAPTTTTVAATTTVAPTTTLAPTGMASPTSFQPPAFLQITRGEALATVALERLSSWAQTNPNLDEADATKPSAAPHWVRSVAGETRDIYRGGGRSPQCLTRGVHSA